MAAKPWTRRKSETDEAFAAFCSYRDQLAPRRLWAVRVHGLAVDAMQIGEWYRSHTWKERVAAYDAHLDDIRLSAREAQLATTVKDLTARHVGLLAESNEIVSAELSKLKEKVQTGAISALNPLQLLKFMDLQVKYDRLVSGQTTENVGGAYDFSKLSEEEHEKLLELLGKAAEVDDPPKP